VSDNSVMVERILKKSIADRLFQGKTIVLIGPRQVGKTTLIQQVLKGEEFLFLNGDDPLVRTILTNPTTMKLNPSLEKIRSFSLTRRNAIENIGRTSKIIHDQFQRYSANY
jgi:uncharacterized protein